MKISEASQQFTVDDFELSVRVLEEVISPVDTSVKNSEESLNNIIETYSNLFNVDDDIMMKGEINSQSTTKYGTKYHSAHKTHTRTILRYYAVKPM